METSNSLPSKEDDFLQRVEAMLESKFGKFCNDLDTRLTQVEVKVEEQTATIQNCVKEITSGDHADGASVEKTIDDLTCSKTGEDKLCQMFQELIKPLQNEIQAVSAEVSHFRSEISNNDQLHEKVSSLSDNLCAFQTTFHEGLTKCSDDIKKLTQYFENNLFLRESKSSESIEKHEALLSKEKEMVGQLQAVVTGAFKLATKTAEVKQSNEKVTDAATAMLKKGDELLQDCIQQQNRLKDLMKDALESEKNRNDNMVKQMSDLLSETTELLKQIEQDRTTTSKILTTMTVSFADNNKTCAELAEHVQQFKNFQETETELLKEGHDLLNGHIERQNKIEGLMKDNMKSDQKRNDSLIKQMTDLLSKTTELLKQSDKKREEMSTSLAALTVTSADIKDTTAEFSKQVHQLKDIQITETNLLQMFTFLMACEMDRNKNGVEILKSIKDMEAAINSHLEQVNETCLKQEQSLSNVDELGNKLKEVLDFCQQDMVAKISSADEKAQELFQFANRTVCFFEQTTKGVTEIVDTVFASIQQSEEEWFQKLSESLSRIEDLGTNQEEYLKTTIEFQSETLQSQANVSHLLDKSQSLSANLFAMLEKTSLSLNELEKLRRSTVKGIDTINDVTAKCTDACALAHSLNHKENLLLQTLGNLQLAEEAVLKKITSEMCEQMKRQSDLVSEAKTRFNLILSRITEFEKQEDKNHAEIKWLLFNDQNEIRQVVLNAAQQTEENFGVLRLMVQNVDLFPLTKSMESLERTQSELNSSLSEFQRSHPTLNESPRN